MSILTQRKTYLPLTKVHVNSHPKENISTSKVPLDRAEATQNDDVLRNETACSKLFLPGTTIFLHREQSLPAYVPTPDPPLSITVAQPPFPISSRTFIPPTSSPISPLSPNGLLLTSAWWAGLRYALLLCRGGGVVATPASIHGAMRPLGGGAASLDPVVTGLPQSSGGHDPSKWQCQH
jgi:hypothetical protein